MSTPDITLIAAGYFGQAVVEDAITEWFKHQGGATPENLKVIRDISIKTPDVFLEMVCEHIGEQYVT